MKKLAKTLYVLNSVTFIFTGLLHTYAHYNELATDTIKNLLNHKIMVTGIEANIWQLWQGMSVMMGILLIFIGLLHLLIIRNTKKEDYPSIGGSIIMILILLSVMTIWYWHEGAWQVQGSAFGILLQSICLGLSIRNK